jgi:gamma-glutamyltranspeptidase/glutathione hydrolase/leukotriene-C4 hydrolase
LKPSDALKSPVDFKGYSVKGTQGAVAVESEICSNIGVDSNYTLVIIPTTTIFIYFLIVLKKGGNAVDAAVASTLCIGVIDSFATGKDLLFALLML